MKKKEMIADPKPEEVDKQRKRRNEDQPNTKYFPDHRYEFS